MCAPGSAEDLRLSYLFPLHIDAHACCATAADSPDDLWTASAASSINATTSAGCETTARWPEEASTVRAAIRCANIRSASGGMASSLAATRYHDGWDFHAGTPITSSKVLIDRPCW